jgi:hypothetical protein
MGAVVEGVALRGFSLIFVALGSFDRPLFQLVFQHFQNLRTVRAWIKVI